MAQQSDEHESLNERELRLQNIIEENQSRIGKAELGQYE